MLAIIVLYGIVMGIGTLYLFNQYFKQDLVLAQTIAFTTLVMFEMFAVIGNRSLKPFRKLNPFTNIWLLLAVISSIVIQLVVIYFPPLQPIFGTTSLTLAHWLQIIGVSSIGFLFMETTKFFVRSRKVTTH